MNDKSKILNMDVTIGLRKLSNKSVHCVITSPPYWGLRDYGIDGQIGLEPTPEEYIEKMILIFREVKRVLRDDGTLWLNIGDLYTKQKVIPSLKLKPKDLVGIPWRLAFALQEDGWYLRSDIIWAKPNPMPEPVTDRPIRSHEYIFLLTKNSKYFYDNDAVREPHKEPNRGKGEHERINNNTGGIIGRGRVGEYVDGVRLYNPAGRNLRDVWTIPTQPTPEAHFATFPEKLVEPCIKAGTSERGCCSNCGSPIQRVDTNWKPTCVCNAETIPCTVLDPFGGSGTVAKVARDLNRRFILIEINPAYVDIAKKKIHANEQLFDEIEIIM